MAVLVERRLTATPDAVWAVLGDVRRWPAWLPTVTDLQPFAAVRPEAVGEAYAVTQPRLGTKTWTITRWEPGRGFTWRCVAPGITTTGTHDVEPDGAADGEGSLVRLGIAWSGPLGFLGPLFYGSLTRRYVEREAAALADRLAVS